MSFAGGILSYYNNVVDISSPSASRAFAKSVIGLLAIDLLAGSFLLVIGSLALMQKGGFSAPPMEAGLILSVGALILTADLVTVLFLRCRKFD